MTFFKPRIYGLRLAAGIVLWVGTGLVVLGFVLFAVPSIRSGSGNSGVLALALIFFAMLAISASFWRGNEVARWLAILPGLGILLAAVVWWGLTGQCAAAAPMSIPDSSMLWPWSCPEPRPPGSLISWVGTAALVGAGGLVLVGVFRPGVRDS